MSDPTLTVCFPQLGCSSKDLAAPAQTGHLLFGETQKHKEQ